MKNTALRELRLENCSMTNANMEHLVQGLGLNSQKNMRSIQLHTINMQPDSHKPLTSYLGHVNPRALEELELSNVNLSDAAIEVLCLMFRKNT